MAHAETVRPAPEPTTTPRGSAPSWRWRRDSGTSNSDHREFQQRGFRAAKLGPRGDEPCRHTACDRPSRLQPRAFRRARLVLERALKAR